MKHQQLSTTPEISKRMANVHLKEGKAEAALAKALWNEGFRYRKNYKKLPGSPDIAILKQLFPMISGRTPSSTYEFPKSKISISLMCFSK